MARCAQWLPTPVQNITWDGLWFLVVSGRYCWNLCCPYLLSRLWVYGDWCSIGSVGCCVLVDGVVVLRVFLFVVVGGSLLLLVLFFFHVLFLGA